MTISDEFQAFFSNPTILRRTSNMIKKLAVLGLALAASVAGVGEARAQCYACYHTVYTDSDWSLGQRFSTIQEAQNDAQWWINNHSKVMGIWDVCSGRWVTVTTGKSLSEYISQVSAAYARAKAARDQARGYVSGLTDQQFHQVNQLINDFNSVRQQAVSAYGSSSFANYPPLALLNWYMYVRLNGVQYLQGPFTDWNSLVNQWNSLKRSYPTLVYVRSFAL
jgi:hypothetical protein